jgi:penicillin-insensitive murein endopeptidase
MVHALVKLTAVAALAAVIGCASNAADTTTPANKLFGAKSSASAQPPAPIGAYAKGCIAGAEQLPESGPTWQAMRLSRNRNWGHPELVAFLKRLSAEATRHGWAGLHIGDMSQPRGGPMTSGHASHQIGLDADIWMLPPKRLNLTRAERESISSVSVRTPDQTRVTANWTPAHMAIIRAAARDPAVDRIFIAAAAKIEMCRTAGRDRDWLQKVRPLYGHDTHFHVRLKCPAGTRGCETQSPTVAELSKGGDGCDDSLTWWVTTYLEELRNPPKPDPKAPKKPRPKGPRDYTMADLPRACGAVLAAK